MLPGTPRLQPWTCSGCGTPSSCSAARERQDDVARRDAVVDVLLVEIELALVELEGADAAGIDDLDRDRLRGVHGPGDVVLDRLRSRALA